MLLLCLLYLKKLEIKTSEESRILQINLGKGGISTSSLRGVEGIMKLEKAENLVLPCASQIGSWLQH